MTSAAAGGRLTTSVYDPNTRLFARHTPLAAHSPMCRPAGRPSGSSRPPPPDSVLWADRVGSRHPRARFRVPGCWEVSQPGLPSCLVGCKVILDEGVDDEGVCG